MSKNYSCVILAAGASSRMTNWKPGTLLGNKTILHHTLSAASGICNDIVVVGGFNFPELRGLISTVSKELGTEIKCTENKNYISGMFSSVRKGLSETINENIFIALSDMPFVNVETYNRLINFNLEHHNEYDVIFPAKKINSERDKKGHPVLISSAVKERILNSDDNLILRDVLKEFRTVKCIVDDEGINFDIDTDEDLEKAKLLLTQKEN